MNQIKDFNPRYIEKLSFFNILNVSQKPIPKIFCRYILTHLRIKGLHFLIHLENVTNYYNRVKQHDKLPMIIYIQSFAKCIYRNKSISKTLTVRSCSREKLQLSLRQTGGKKTCVSNGDKL